MKKQFKLSDIPFEVQKVWAYQSLNQSVGLELYKEIEATIEKYPQYFQWEHTYNSIPKEVHSKYSEEQLNLYYSFYPPSGLEMKEGEGLVGYMRRVEEENKNKPEKSMREVIIEICETAPKIKKEYETEKRKLWDKHYKEYNLKYRK